MSISVPQFVITLAMIALFGMSVIYRWLRVDRREDRSGISRISVIGILLQSLGFAIAGAGRIEIGRSLLEVSSLAMAATVLLLGLGASGLFLSAAHTLGHNWSLVARTRQRHELVRHGPFAYIRHPIYLAMLLLLLALAIGFGHPKQLIVALPVFLIGTAIRIRSEDRLLRQLFGKAFEEYARSVPALIPHI